MGRSKVGAEPELRVASTEIGIPASFAEAMTDNGGASAANCSLISAIRQNLVEKDGGDLRIRLYLVTLGLFHFQ